MISTHPQKLRGAAAVIVLTLCVWAMLMMTGCADAPKPAAAAAKKADDKPKVAQATNEIVFETKAAFEDDIKTKDPFFPNSKRRLAKAAPTKSSVPEAPKFVEIRLKGVIGSPGRYIAMINDKTFAEGEKSQVLIGPGQNLVVKVTKITAKTATVMVDGEAAPRELSLDTIQEARK